MIRRLLSIVLVMLALVAGGVSAQDDPLTVVATTTILADVARNVGGDLVEVSSLLPPDADTHAYEPTAADAVRVAEADMLLTVGAGYEGFISDLLENAGADLEPVVVSNGIEILPSGIHLHEHEGEDHEHAEDEHEGEADEHEHEGEGDHADEAITGLSPWAGEWVSVWALGAAVMQPGFDAIVASTPELTEADVLAYFEAGNGTSFDTFAVEGETVTYTTGDESVACTYVFTGSETVVAFPTETWWLFATSDEGCAAYRYLLLMPVHAAEAGSTPHFHMRYSSEGFAQAVADDSVWYPSLYPVETEGDAVVNSWVVNARAIGLYIASTSGIEVAMTDEEMAAAEAPSDDHEHEHADEDHDEGEEAHEHEHEGEGEHLGVLGDGLTCDSHDHSEDEAEGEEGGDGHDHGECDPHVWLDPHNVEVWARNIADAFAAADPANAETYQTNADAYIEQLEALDAELEAIVSVVPDDRRVLVTNHEFLGYFAHRYGFEVVATVLPGVATGAEPSPQDVAELVTLIQEEGVPAIFAEVSANPQLAEVIAAESGTAVVGTLYTEALSGEDGPAATYLDYMRTNAQTIADALAG